MIDDYQIVTKKEEPKDVEFRYKQEDTLIEIIRVITNFKEGHWWLMKYIFLSLF